jgi:predicted nucleic acid-binding protein
LRSSTAQNQADFEALEEQLDALRQVPLTQGIVRSARAALHTLSATNHHRLPFQDALIAASAAHKSWGVLHYDGDFDTLSNALAFESRWIAPPGSLFLDPERPHNLPEGSFWGPPAGS